MFSAGPFLYIDRTMILSIPTFKEVSCDQNFPSSVGVHVGPGLNSAGVVTYKGTNTVMYCRLLVPCLVWTKSGWIEIGPEWDR